MRVPPATAVRQDSTMPVPPTPAPDPARWYAQSCLSGTKVRLVPLQIEHAAGFRTALHAQDGAAAVYQWLGSPAPAATEDAARAEVVLALAARSRGERLPYAQLDASTGEFIGTTSFYEVNPAARALAIGYTWLGMPWWRTGHNTESKLLMLTEAFEALGAARVVWHTDVRNERSRRAIERLGATSEGVLRKHRIRANGTWRDSAQYAMTDDDWPAVKQQLHARLQR